MTDPDCSSPACASALPRSIGGGGIVFDRRGSHTIAARVFQSGCLRIRFPRLHDGGGPTGMLLNTAGGLAGGDRIALEARWNPGACATLTTATAERVYRALDGPAEVRVRLALDDEAHAEWLPQETILFDGAHLDRRLDVEVASSARLLAVEALIFGRHARGEVMDQGALHDRWTIRRAGELVFHDRLQMQAPIAALLDRPALGAGARAVATVLFASPDAEHHVGAVREAIGSSAGASAFDGLLLARLIAPDGQRLRRMLSACVQALRGRRSLARTWTTS